MARLDREVERLMSIPGIVPNAYEFPVGCKYNTRCPLIDDHCIAQEPELREVTNGHKVRCWNYEKLEELKKRDKYCMPWC